MRILPIALAMHDEPQAERIRITQQAASLTHAHPRSRLACVLYVELAVLLLAGIPPHDAIERLNGKAETIIRDAGEEARHESQHFGRIIGGTPGQLSEREIASSGYVVHTFEASIWALLTSTSYKQTVLKAVNLGEDTDTTGAVAGGLAGIVWGKTDIPDSWLQVLARREEIEASAEGLGQMRRG